MRSFSMASSISVDSWSERTPASAYALRLLPRKPGRVSVNGLAFAGFDLVQLALLAKENAGIIHQFGDTRRCARRESSAGDRQRCSRAPAVSSGVAGTQDGSMMKKSTARFLLDSST